MYLRSYVYIRRFSNFYCMPKWKKDAKEFSVSVNYNESRGYQSSIPKPVMDALGNPNTLKFEMSGNAIKMTSGDKEAKKPKAIKA